MKKDNLARRLAALALAVAMLAAMLGAYAVTLGQQYLEDVRTLGQVLERQQGVGAEFISPPPVLETE